MAKKQLTTLEIHEKIRQRVDYVKKWFWIFKIGFTLSMVGFLLALIMGDTRGAIISSLAAVMMLLVITRHNQYQLTLILWDELRSARGLPADSSEANEGE